MGMEMALLVSLMCQVNYAKHFMHSFPIFLLCKNEIAVLIAIQWKTVYELIKDTIDESPSCNRGYDLYVETKLFAY